MANAVKMLLWAGIVLDSCGRSVSLPEITDGKFIDECVRGHNGARSSVSPAAGDMLYMTWDEGLAVIAKAWASNCLFEHNTQLKGKPPLHPSFSSLGENIWTGYPPSHFDPSRAVTSWVDEKQDYDYNGNTCSKVCGHYTQVVWASSYKVGCAAQLCPNGVKSTNFGSKESVVFVCNYGPAGNVNRRRPYEHRAAGCSKCNGTCVDNLCRNQERDSQKKAPGYDATSHWNYGNNYGTILVVRPVSLIFTFITAYAVRHFYPQIFCYE